MLPTLLAAVAPIITSAETPNVVIVLADDLGYGDVRPLNPNSTIPTPAFDRLAREGMTFTDAHTSAAVCTPTRYALLTGRHCWRTRLKSGVLGGYSKPLIDAERQTIADIAKQAGYRTGVVGKWHLGLGWQFDGEPTADLDKFGRGGAPGKVQFDKPLTHGPADLGFDRSFLYPASLDMSPYVFVEDGKTTGLPTATLPGDRFPAFHRGGEGLPGFDIRDVLDQLVDQATRFITDGALKDSTPADAPFLLYFPLTSPHKPVAPHARFVGKTDIGPYGDFVAQTDDAVGRVLAALDEAGVADNTLVIITSDNGSYMHALPDGKPDHVTAPTVQGYHPDHHRPNGPLRGTKADIYEAGHRVPFFVRLPGVVKAGSRTDATVCQTDILGTLAELLGVEQNTNSSEDSFSMLSLLKGEEHTRRPVVHQSASGMLAIRDGRWKLIAGDGSGGRLKPRGKAFNKPYQLYDLEADLGETNDVSADHPDVVTQLTAQLLTIRDGNP